MHKVYDSAGLKPEKVKCLISFTQSKGRIRVVDRPNKTITVKQSLVDLQADWLVRVLAKWLDHLLGGEWAVLRVVVWAAEWVQGLVAWLDLRLVCLWGQKLAGKKVPRLVDWWALKLVGLLVQMLVDLLVQMLVGL